ncbi:MAG: DUF6463 family protein [Thiohalomonadales bacterium]
MQLWRYSGILLIFTGVIHNSIGIFLGWDFLLAIVNDGLWNTIALPATPGAEHTRAELLWFLMLGFTWMMLGAKFHADIKTQQKPLSIMWGWLILVQGLVVAILFPQTGAWFFIPQGLIIIFAYSNPFHFSTYFRGN